VNKAELRKDAMARIRTRDPRDLAQWVRRIVARIPQLEAYARARSLMLYDALPGEVPVDGIAECGWRDGKNVALPRCQGEVMMYHRTAPGSRLVRGALGVREPDLGAQAEDLSAGPCLCLVPGLLFDCTGIRLGRGGGFFDRFVDQCRRSRSAVFFLGVCCEDQIREQLPKEGHDQPIDAVITESRLCGPRAGLLTG
jgi:5-formyltetrahydrofolate cyclo-ligase